MEKIYKTAIYLRLSLQDLGKTESDSIKNQRDLLTSFVESREDLELITEFKDDGYSGYDFNRPGFQEMLTAVKNCEIDCIVVKDLSRIGRNFIETEEYIQLTFPRMGVRFIAIGNDFDTSREKTFTDLIAAPIINLANEFHIAETSQKIRKSQALLRKKGEFISNYAVYGYIKEGRKLIPDLEPAEVIREIFSLKIEGFSQRTIAKKLNERGVLCPMEYKLSKGYPVSTSMRVYEKARWSAKIVGRILSNPAYIGTLVLGKTFTKNYKDKKRKPKDKSEQDIFEYSFEPIVSELVFQIVSDLLKVDSYSTGLNKSYLFSGLTFCGNCGAVLIRRTEKTKNYYRCKNIDYKSHKNIREDVLYKTVHTLLKRHFKLCQEIPQKIILTSNSEIYDVTIAYFDNEIERLENIINFFSEKKKENISETELREMTGFYNEKIDEIKCKREDYLNCKKIIAECGDEIMETYRNYADFEELERKILVTFVSRITVNDSEEITVQFRYADLFSGNYNGTEISKD